ncbi:galactose oxidase [Paludisphaera mucosa]|uniref:Galactose oxidase n=1 Tax=Paludisphaera mucosa TaxID=3030827 RepID=A0ABT6FFE9_9BACT|nr:galactose oxidase [Paludisphaera mucosa]MDG3006221.1 galactose oxidase [Paludisphaera mucosa]
MRSARSRKFFWALLVAAALPQTARAHFIWLKAEPGAKPGETVVQAFFNEDPEPDAAFQKHLRDLKLTVDGQVVPSELTAATRRAGWGGKPPILVDAEHDLGLMTKGGKSYRLYYTARAQTEAVADKTKEAADKLRARLVATDSGPVLEVLFNGSPVAKARVKVYPSEGAATEATTDESGRLAIAGLAEGRTAVWANHVDPTAGEVAGKPFTETRFYATLTFTPASTLLSGKAPLEATTIASIPDPAVNSFGGAVQGKWLYIYGGHVGKTHSYDVNTTSRHFRRLNLEDGRTWEELPMERDLQGLALLSDGRYLYRLGGMAALNQPGDEHDLHSVAEFARFDPEAKAWTAMAPLPEPRSTHDAVVIGRTIYAVGGWNMKGATEESTFLENVAAFNLDKPEDGWKTIPQPFQRRALSAAGREGKLYVLGGLVGGGMTVDRRVDVYDPASGAWSRGPDLPGGGRTEGFGTSAFEVAGRIYYSGASGRIFRMNDAGDAWEAVGAWALPRLTHRLLPGLGDTILAVGGNARGAAQTAVIEAVRIEGPRPTTTASTTR